MFRNNLLERQLADSEARHKQLELELEKERHARLQAEQATRRYRDGKGKADMEKEHRTDQLLSVLLQQQTHLKAYSDVGLRMAQVQVEVQAARTEAARTAPHSGLGARDSHSSGIGTDP